MGWVAFSIAFLYVCLGFAAGTLLSRRGLAAAATAAATPAAPPPDDDPIFKIRGDQAAEFLDRIHKLTSHVDSGVDRHATRVAEISDGLSGEQRLTVNAAEAAASQLIEANQQLQQDLASAKEELKTQRRLLDSYMAEALTDPLTGLGNRRKFDQELARRFAQWRRCGTPLTLVLVDVDHFKCVNDEHGHSAGDAVLHDVAQVLADCVREARMALSTPAISVSRKRGIVPETSLPSISDIRGWARMRSSSSNRKATPEAVRFSRFNTSCVESISRSPAITPPRPCFKADCTV
jgi:hypothetical protein